MYSLGADIGYTSVKIVLIDENAAVQHVYYKEHKGDSIGVVQDFLEEIGKDYPWPDIKYGAVTGTGAKIFDGKDKIHRINEVAALVEGAEASTACARSIAEIGGQSAKYITGIGEKDRSGIKVAMNSNCSAGTGSFLEEQVSRLKLRLDDYSQYAAKAKTIPRIAGRCSVFAKTDITHHQQEGVPVEDILLGLAYALIRNFRASVIRKLKKETPILFAGGVARNQGVVIAFKDLLKLKDNELIVPDHMDSLAALGAAMIALHKRIPVDLEQAFSNLDRPEAIISVDENEVPLEPLAGFGSNDDLGKHEIALTDNRSDKLLCYLGVDVGSTSTNLVLCDRDDRIIDYRYLRTLGDPVEAVQGGLKSLKQAYGDRLRILGACTTGSGRQMTGRLIRADVVKDEITAQARAAVAIDPAVTVIFEIGGQDSKYIRLQEGVVTDFQMNKVCAAGTGSFIEEQAKKFDIPVNRIGDLALRSLSPVNLGERCTVFMETSIAGCLARGTKIEDITAGLCYAIVKNYLSRVVGQKPVDGTIFFQGGVAYNQGVVNAFRCLTGKKIVVPPFFSVTGGYGAAILAKEAMAGRPTTFKGFDLETKEHFLHSDKKITVEKKTVSKFDTIIEDLVFEGYRIKIDPDRQTIGIPRALFTFGMFSMFHRIFTELGFNVLLSDPTSEKTIGMGQEYSLDETCYPVKLINGHVAELVQKKVDFIFFPDLYTVDHPGSSSRKNYGCAYMQLAFKVVNQAMDLSRKGIGLLSPTIAFSLGKEFMAKSFSEMGRQLGKTQAETMQALQKGVKAFHNFESKIEKAGKIALKKLDPDRKVFVIISKIYGVADPILNMGIPDKLMEMGFQVLPFFFLPEGDLSKTHPNMYWPFGQHILEPAQFIREHPNFYAILLTHHGCGPDSVLAHFFREEMHGKSYLHIEVDEHTSGVGVITRLEAFVNSLDHPDRHRTESGDTDQNKVVPKDENIKKDILELRPDTTLFLPRMHPFADIFKALLLSKGVSAEVLPTTDRHAVDIGRQFTIAEEYFSLTALMGTVFSQCRSKTNGNHMTFLVPRTEGAEVDGQYSRMLRMKLDEEGYAGLDIFSPFLEDLLDLEATAIYSLFLGILAGDVVQAAAEPTRHTYFQRMLSLIRENRLGIESLKAMAREISREASPRHGLKRLLVVGEPIVLYNDYMNDFVFKSIEQKGHRVCYAPFSEAMWLFWHDYAIQNGRREEHIRSLNRFADDIRTVSDCLGQESPFEKNIDFLVNSADNTVGYYSGAFGRFRAAKVSGGRCRFDGIITVASTYENTGISLNILHNAFAQEGAKPVLNLTFDGNRNENDITKWDSFLYYL
ncbi:activase [Desulfosarcina widdelii]|uniref:Activase n=1 Tax=Desulfosarcina widdelii TaxID=947919 RepID=A0A5K7Z961_9BACT|nr:acyl-CoA dehydratase activase [Desulfosarcina widdelii]BBO78562.1 activase [Desulfosarcina widdelii]